MTKLLLILAVICISLRGQTQPLPLSVTSITGITSTLVIDNRSDLRRNTNHAIYVTGSGTWSVSLEYSTAASGPWTAFPASTGTISNASNPSIASSFGYANFIRVHIISGTGLVINYSAIKTFYINPSSGGGGGGSGTVTSVGLALPSIFTVSNSPVTAAGTLTATLASQLRNLFFASPDGTSGSPIMRAILATDLPVVTIFSNVSNAYSSGAKQTFTPSASLSGVRVVPGALPSSPSAGDFAIDSGAANVLKVYDGSSWIATSGGGTSPGVCSANQVVIQTTSGGVVCVSLSVSYLPAATVYTTQTNTFGAGFKQIFTPSASVAGLRIVAAALPSSPATGDVAIDSGASNVLKVWNGSSWVSATGVPAGTCTAGQVVFATTVSGVTCISMIQAITGNTGTATVDPSTGKVDVDSTALGAQNLVITGQFSNAGSSVALPYRHVTSDQSGACTTNGQTALNTNNGNKFTCISLIWAKNPSLTTANTYAGGALQDFGTSVIDLGRLSAEPGSCAVGSMYFNTVSAKSRVCNTVNVWSDLGGSGGLTLTNPAINRICVPNAGLTSLDCNPAGGGGGPLIWNGFIFTLPGVMQLYWNATGNAATCNTIYTIRDTVSSSTKIILTGNCTLSSNGLVDGAVQIIEFCQDATGSRTVAWPSNYSGTMTVGSTANLCSVQMFTGDSSRGKWLAVAAGVINQ